MSFKQTPSQTIGPYFAYGLTPEQYGYQLDEIASGVMADETVSGEHITIVGQVFDGEGVPITDAMIELWQADAKGKYAGAKNATSNTGFSGFGRFGTGTDPENRFIFNTVKPGAAEAGSAPHVSIIIFMRGMLTHAYTRAYFSDETAANNEDPVLNSVPEARRDTVIAKRQEQDGKVIYRFDIHMQGEAETVFFDV